MPSGITVEDKSKLLPQSKLRELDARFAANAQRWLADNAPTATIKILRMQKGPQGPKPKLILNPFYGFIGCTTHWGRYPAFAMDIIEGVARLDWYDRPINAGGKSNPLSVRNLVVILEKIPLVSNEAIEDSLQLKERHARRYFKAVELIIPRMMLSRPQSLIYEMSGISPEPRSSQWEDNNELCTPTSEELDQLHRDLQAPTEYKTAEEYEAEYEAELSGSTTTPRSAPIFAVRTEHPKKAEAMAMLKQGIGTREIARTLGVSPNSIIAWKASAPPDKEAA